MRVSVFQIKIIQVDINGDVKIVPGTGILGFKPTIIRLRSFGLRIKAVFFSTKNPYSQDQNPCFYYVLHWTNIDVVQILTDLRKKLWLKLLVIKDNMDKKFYKLIDNFKAI